MKITTLSPEISNSAKPERGVRESSTEAKPFDEVLKETTGNGEHKGIRAEAPAQEQALSNIKAQEGTVPDRAGVVKRTEKLLDLLEEYQGGLGDREMPLAEISSVIERMEGEIASLTKMMESLPEEDELRGVLRETLLTSSVEIARFHRGDYQE